MKIADNIITNILGNPRLRGGHKDFDGDGVPNKKDCQSRNTMRQDASRLWKVTGDHKSNGMEIIIYVQASSEMDAINKAEIRKPQVDFWKAE